MSKTTKQPDNTIKETKKETVKEKIQVKEAVAVTYMDPSNTTFAAQADFVRLDAKLPNDEDVVEDLHYDRVYFHKSFPFDRATEFISVLDDENREIGLIRDITVFDAPTQRLIVAELDKKYYAPKITAIHSIKEKYGYSTWKVETDSGAAQLSVRDTYRSLIRAEEGRLFLLDADQNRYEIPDYKLLDKKSFKLIDMYL